MAFSYEIKSNDSTGNYRVIGTYNAASVTTGTVVTGLKSLLHVSLMSDGSATSPYCSRSGGSFTITCASSDTGTFEAIGK